MTSGVTHAVTDQRLGIKQASVGCMLICTPKEELGTSLSHASQQKQLSAQVQVPSCGTLPSLHISHSRCNNKQGGRTEWRHAMPS